jgi:hypothetical protein
VGLNRPTPPAVVGLPLGHAAVKLLDPMAPSDEKVITIQDLIGDASGERLPAPPSDALPIGGTFGRPHLSCSYARAARKLQESSTSRAEATELLAPTMFCIRHAVELALKDLLIAFHDNELAQGDIDRHDGRSTSSSPLEQGELNAIVNNHDLGRLLDLVEKHLSVYVQPTWRQLVIALDGYESGEVERFRFDTVGKTAKGTARRAEPSFPGEKRAGNVLASPTYIEVGALLGKLDAFMLEAAVIPPPAELRDARSVSALMDLDLAAQTLAHELYARGIA